MPYYIYIVSSSETGDNKSAAYVSEFGNFKEEEGLTLPHSYVLNLEIQTGNGSWIYRWDMDIQRFMFNTDIDPREFKVDSY